MSVVLAGEPTFVSCEDCRAPVVMDEAVWIATRGVSGSNEFWHHQCWDDALEEHPEWLDQTFNVCRACHGTGDYDDVLRCEDCDGSGAEDY